MLYFLVAIQPLLWPVLLAWFYFFYKQRDTPLLFVSILLLLFHANILLDIQGFLRERIMYGISFNYRFNLAMVSMFFGIWGIIRSVKGLMVTILRSDAVVDSWNYVVEQGAGKGDFVFGTIEILVIDAHMPGVTTRREEVAIELFGEKRTFLIVQHARYKEFKMVTAQAHQEVKHSLVQSR